MGKTKIRLSESELVSLIKKSLIKEDVQTLTDASLGYFSKNILRLMQGDVEAGQMRQILNMIQQTIGNVASDGSCALQKMNSIYANPPSIWWRGDMKNAGGTWDILGDIKKVSMSDKALKQQVIDLMEKEYSTFCLNPKKYIEDEKAAKQAAIDKKKADEDAQIKKDQETKAAANLDCAKDEKGFSNEGDWFKINLSKGFMTAYNDGRPLAKGNIRYESSDGKTIKYATAVCIKKGPENPKGGLTIQTPWEA